MKLRPIALRTNWICTPFQIWKSNCTFHSACWVVHLWQSPDTEGSVPELSGRWWTCPVGWIQSRMGQELGRRSTFSLFRECCSRSGADTRWPFSLFCTSMGRKCHSDSEDLKLTKDWPVINYLSFSPQFFFNPGFPNIHFGKPSIVILSTLQPCQSSVETTFALGSCQIAAIKPPLSEMFWTRNKKVWLQWDWKILKKTVLNGIKVMKNPHTHWIRSRIINMQFTGIQVSCKQNSFWHLFFAGL